MKVGDIYVSKHPEEHYVLRLKVTNIYNNGYVRFISLLLAGDDPLVKTTWERDYILREYHLDETSRMKQLIELYESR